MGINTLKTTTIKAVEPHTLEFTEPITIVNITLYEDNSSTKTPLVNTIVSAKNTTSSMGKAITLTTDNNGKVTFELTSGIWEITSKPVRSDLNPETKIVYAGDYYVTLDKTPKYGGQLTVTLLCKGSPVSNSRIILSRNKYEDIIGTTDNNGICIFNQVPIGEWNVTSESNIGYSNPTSSIINIQKDVSNNVTVYQSLITDTPNPPTFITTNIIGGKNISWYSEGSEGQNIKYYYTLDGSEPTSSSVCANNIDIKTGEETLIKVKAYNVDTNYWSLSSSETIKVVKVAPPNYLISNILGGKKVLFTKDSLTGDIYCSEDSSTLSKTDYIDIKRYTTGTRVYAQIRNVEGFLDSDIIITKSIIIDKATPPNKEITDIKGGKRVTALNYESTGVIFVGYNESEMVNKSFLDYKEAIENGNFYTLVKNVLGKADSDIYCYQDITVPKAPTPVVTKSFDNRVLTLAFTYGFTMKYGWYGVLEYEATNPTIVNHVSTSDDNGVITAYTYKDGYADSDIILEDWQYISFIGQFVSIGTDDAWHNTSGIEWVQGNDGISPRSIHTNHSYLESITANSERYITTGLYGESFYSIYGDSWIYMTGLKDFSTEQSVAIDYPFVTYGNNKFITISNDGMATTPDTQYESTNGTNWKSTTIVIGQDTNIIGGNYVNDKFIIFGTKGKAYYSFTGDEWLAVNGLSEDNTLFHRVCYGNNKYIACGNKGAIGLSDDGINWSIIHPIDNTSNYKSICYADSKFVIISEEGNIYYSTNGNNWVEVLHSEDILTGIIFGYNRFMVSGYNKSYYSYDGENWTELTLGFNSEDIIYSTVKRG